MGEHTSMAAVLQVVLQRRPLPCARFRNVQRALDKRAHYTA